jgi:hypothetical protein
MKRKQTLITDYFNNKITKIIIKGYNKETNTWHCISCGKNNPRQYYHNSYCPYKQMF